MEKLSIEISKPRQFGVLSILGKYAFSFLLLLPFLAVFLVISFQNLGRASLVILFCTLVGTVCVSPALGNLYVFWTVRGLRPAESSDSKPSIVQISFIPRIRRGLRALLEDADDVGYLSLNGAEINFVGDSVRLSIPIASIKTIEGENVGIRGLYLAAGRITLRVSGFDEFEEIEIAERSSRLIFSSRRITQDLFTRIKSRQESQ